MGGLDKTVNAAAKQNPGLRPTFFFKKNMISYDMYECSMSDAEAKKAATALAKAKEVEQKDFKKGMRYVKFSNCKILVPLKNGKPTAQGREIIRTFKEHLMIK